MSDRNDALTLMSFLAGGLIGAGVALLYSPRSGKENRDELLRVLDRVKGQALLKEKKMELTMFRAVDDITNRVIDILSEGKELSEQKKLELLDAISEAKHQLDHEKESIS